MNTIAIKDRRVDVFDWEAEVEDTLFVLLTPTACVAEPRSGTQPRILLDRL
jgi:hypothetical protein